MSQTLIAILATILFALYAFLLSAYKAQKAKVSFNPLGNIIYYLITIGIGCAIAIFGLNKWVIGIGVGALQLWGKVLIDFINSKIGTKITIPGS